MLTRKQHQLLTYIQRRLRTDGVSPSFEEMKDALGLRSKSGIHRLITALVERGFIRRLPHRARALEVLKFPQQPVPAARAGGFAPSVIQGRFKGPLSGLPVSETDTTVALPLYGRIAAGTPIEALRDPSTTIEVATGMLERGEHYALEVAGDSMIEAGIFDGDIAIIRRCDTADNGAIVVALVDGNEATLKRLRRKGDSIALEPANAAHEIRIFGPDHVKVQGRLVTLIRRY